MRKGIRKLNELHPIFAANRAEILEQRRREGVRL